MRRVEEMREERRRDIREERIEENSLIRRD